MKVHLCISLSLSIYIHICIYTPWKIHTYKGEVKGVFVDEGCAGLEIGVPWVKGVWSWWYEVGRCVVCVCECKRGGGRVLRAGVTNECTHSLT